MKNRATQSAAHLWYFCMIRTSFPSPPPSFPSPPSSSHLLYQNLYGAPFLVSAASVLLAMWVAMALKSDRGSKKEDDPEEEQPCSASIPCISKPRLKKKAETEIILMDIDELPQT